MKVKDLFTHLEEHKKVCKELDLGEPYIDYRIKHRDRYMAGSIDDMISEIQFELHFNHDVKMTKASLMKAIKQKEIKDSEFTYKGVTIIFFGIKS